MDLNISPDQVKLLYSQAGKPLEYVNQKFSYDSEVEVTENVSFCNTALKQTIIFFGYELDNLLQEGLIQGWCM